MSTLSAGRPSNSSSHMPAWTDITTKSSTLTHDPPPPRYHPRGHNFSRQRPAFVGHSFGGGTVLQVLSDERERGSRAGAEMDPEETGYSMAFIMDAWTFPCSEEARAQGVDIPVRGCGGGGVGVGRKEGRHTRCLLWGRFRVSVVWCTNGGGGGCVFVGNLKTRLLSFDSLRSFLIRSLPQELESPFGIDWGSPFVLHTPYATCSNLCDQ